MKRSHDDSGVVPLFESVWQLVDSNLIFPVKLIPGHEAPALVDGPDGEVVPVFLNRAHAENGLPAGWVLRQAPMYDLLRDLPPHAGIGIEMGAPNSIYIPADQRPILAPMSVPFPHGASISWGDIPPDKQGLAEAFRDRARTLPYLSALYVAQFQVEDARAKIACLYAGEEEHQQDIVDAMLDVLRERDEPMGVQIIGITDVPMPTRTWLVENMEPLFVRWATDPMERTDE